MFAYCFGAAVAWNAAPLDRQAGNIIAGSGYLEQRYPGQSCLYEGFEKTWTILQVRCAKR